MSTKSLASGGGGGAKAASTPGTNLLLKPTSLGDKIVLLGPVVDQRTGEILVDAGTTVTHGQLLDWLTPGWGKPVVLEIRALVADRPFWVEFAFD